MNIDFIADINILIIALEGNEFILLLLKYNFGITFISDLKFCLLKTILKHTCYL
jgi:hypothetical protein